MRNQLIMKYPASWHGNMWREAMPVGNGEIGGLVYGGVYKEIIALSHGKLWWKSVDSPMPDVSDTLAEMRRLLSDNKVAEAERLMCQAIKENGYNARNASPLPLGDLTILTHTEKGFSKYRRILDMESGEASVSWQEDGSQFTRSFFISRCNDAACCRLTVQGDGLIDADFSLDIHDTETLDDKNALQNIERIAENHCIKYAVTNDDGSDFGAVAYLLHDGMESHTQDTVCVRQAKSITVFLKVFINGSRHTAWPKLQTELSRLNDYSYELEKHKKNHSELFNAVHFDLGGKEHLLSNEELLLDAYQGQAPVELIEKMWSFGRYLLICASRENAYPCHLYGLWAGCYNAMWAFNMFNVNLEMIYWQALSGNMPELLLPVFPYLENKMDDYQENAKKLFACRGINIPSVSTPESGLHKCIAPHIVHWTGAAGWMCQHYFDYYLHTGDTAFLKDRAMPFMYQTALFYEDYLTLDENGFFVSCPSNSPENTPKNIKEALHRESEVVVNATMDFAILKELLTNLIKGAEITGTYLEKIPHWQNMKKHIPPYQVNPDGSVREWMHPFYQDNNEHRHQSHIYPVFPGTEITRSDSEFTAFKKAIENRKAVGLKDQTGWSLAYMSNVYARMGDGNSALECLDLLTRSTLLSNFITVHNDWRRMGIAVCGDLRSAPVQIDANMGFTAAIQEMAVFSTDAELFPFNALPERWKQGKIGPLLTRTNSKVSLCWDMDAKTGTISLKQVSSSHSFRLVLPETARFLSNGRNVMELSLKPGESACLDIRFVSP